MQTAWAATARSEFVEKMERRLQTPAGSVTAGDIEALWQLCQHEAALLGATDRACSLFDPEVSVFHTRRVR